MKQVFTLKESVGAVKSSADLFSKIKKISIDHLQENFLVVFLDTKNKVISSEISLRVA